MSKSETIVVCDAGPLIHLDEINCFSLLNDFKLTLVPHQVWDEVSHHRANALANPDVNLVKVKVTISQDPTFQTLASGFTLDLGEQAALSLMRDHSEAILLTDDAAARLAAETLGYQVHGTIGILIRAIRRQQKSREQILTILRELPHHSTLHIRPGLLEGIIGRVESET